MYPIALSKTPPSFVKNSSTVVYYFVNYFSNGKCEEFSTNILACSYVQMVAIVIIALKRSGNSLSLQATSPWFCPGGLINS